MIVLIPLIALIITQALKIAITHGLNPNAKLKASELHAYGGMPSSHSALFAALATTAFLLYGWNSFEFSVGIILYLTVVRDAVGIRWHLGRHGYYLKQLIDEHVKDHEDIDHDKIITVLGHTPLQATVGTGLGILIAAAGFVMFGM